MGLDACVHVRTTCKELACKRMHAFHATRPSQWGGPAKSAMAAWLHSASPLVQSSRSVIYLLRVAPRISASQPRRGFPADRVNKRTTVCACIRYRIPIASRDTHPFYCGCGRQASEQRHVLLNRCDLHSNQERTSRMNLLTHTHYIHYACSTILYAPPFALPPAIIHTRAPIAAHRNSIPTIIATLPRDLVIAVHPVVLVLEARCGRQLHGQVPQVGVGGVLVCAQADAGVAGCVPVPELWDGACDVEGLAVDCGGERVECDGYRCGCGAG